MPSDPGAKLDANKTQTGILADFSMALNAVAEVGTFGANKYSRGGWQHVLNGIERYNDAMWRHLLAESRHEFDSDSGLRHAAHMAWNALARLELILRKKEDDEAKAKTPCGWEDEQVPVRDAWGQEVTLAE
jgi:hypothetical protein